MYIGSKLEASGAAPNMVAMLEVVSDERGNNLTFNLLFITDVLEERRPPIQHRLVLHPVVVKEEERLLTLLLQGQRGAISLGLIHL